MRLQVIAGPRYWEARAALKRAQKLPNNITDRNTFAPAGESFIGVGQTFHALPTISKEVQDHV